MEDNKLRFACTINCLDSLLLTCDIANQYNRITFCDVFVAVSQFRACRDEHGVRDVWSVHDVRERRLVEARAHARSLFLSVFLSYRQEYSEVLVKIAF